MQACIHGCMQIRLASHIIKIGYIIACRLAFLKWAGPFQNGLPDMACFKMGQITNQAVTDILERVQRRATKLIHLFLHSVTKQD